MGDNLQILNFVGGKSPSEREGMKADGFL